MVGIGWQQGPQVQEIFARAGWGRVSVVQDLGGRPRVVCADKPA